MDSNQYGSLHLVQQLQQHHQPGSNINFNYSSSDTDNDAPNLNNAQSNTANRKIYTTSSFGRQQQQLSAVQPPQLPSNYQMSSFDDRRAVQMNAYASTKSKKQQNMYYEHQQMQQQQQQQQPTYHLHQSPVQVRNRTPSPPPPPPPPPPMIAERLSSATNSYGVNPIQTAASSTAEALGALANAASIRAKNSNCYVQQAPPLPPQMPAPSLANVGEQAKTMTNNVSSISIALNGDRVVMNNVAGSRKPLSGYSSFI